MPGTVVIETFDSRILAGNPLGDPTTRRFLVYLPPGYEAGGSLRWPVIYVLQGFAGPALAVENVAMWGETLSQRCDRLIERAGCPPFIAVVPECATRMGGSQYLNSSATGRYEDYLVEEVVAHTDARFRTRPEAGGRALLGRSSGGYGAFVLAMRHPDVFGALASHAGDMGFEYCYLPDFPKLLVGLGEPPDVARFIEAFGKNPKPSGRDFAVMNVLAMAACYSPAPESAAGFALPFDLHTGRLEPEVWERWLACDPVRLVEHHADALRGARLVYFDCGRRDNYNLFAGARQLAARLVDLKIAHEYEEFDDDHFGLQYRYDVSIPKLLAAMTA